MSLEKLISYTEDYDSEICEFKVQSNSLAKLVKEFIEDYEDEFDPEEGMLLKVSGGEIRGMAPFATCPIVKSDLVDCIIDCFAELGIDEESTEAVRDNQNDILEELESVEWISVSRDLSALDFESNLDCISEEIISTVADEYGKTEDEISLNDEEFVEQLVGFLQAEQDSLLVICSYSLINGEEKYSTEIKRA